MPLNACCILLLRDYVCVDVSTAAVTPLLPAKGAAPCCIVPVSPTGERAGAQGACLC